MDPQINITCCNHKRRNNNCCRFIVLAILNFSLLTFKVFSENISTMNIIAFVIIFTMSDICLCIKSVIEKGWIKEINQKLKERSN